MQILNIIGCGRVGRALARLWHEGGIFTIGDLNDRTAEKSRAAVAFAGSGRACADIAAMRAADIMTPTPRTIDRDMLAEEALRVMEGPPRKITSVVVVDQDGRVEGVIHIHDIWRPDMP